MLLRTLFSFFIRDFKQAISYRLAFFLDLGSIFFNAATFYFLAQLITAGSSPHLAAYGGQYFPFVLIGLAFSTYQSVGLTSLSQSLRQEQYIGTLESVLVSPIRVSTFLTGSALWDFTYATGEVLFYFIIGFAMFGLALPYANVLAALLAFVIILLTFMGLGILAAAFILRFKRGNPITWILVTSSELLGGVYFPVNILPEWLQKISNFIPMTHALEALRKSLLSGAGIAEISTHLYYLLFFAAMIWPIGIVAFSLALQASQKDGTLSHY